MARMDAQSALIIFLSNPVFPVVRAPVFATRVPVLIVIGIALVAVVVIVRLFGHGFSSSITWLSSYLVSFAAIRWMRPT